MGKQRYKSVESNIGRLIFSHVVNQLTGPRPSTVWRLASRSFHVTMSDLEPLGMVILDHELDLHRSCAFMM